MDLPLHRKESENLKLTSPADDYSNGWSRVWLLTVTVSTLVPILFPFIHLGVLSHLWDEFNFEVDLNKCTCSCWDTVFKGPYERGPGGYKHVYFNATSNSLKIWSVTVLAVVLVYEAAKTALLLLYKRQARVSMILLLLLSAYPHYYSWWSYFNYWNDDFYKQWNHQLFFSITELVSTLVVVHLLNRRVPITSRKCLLISAIAALHILSAGFDQFIDNVVRGNGALHQVLRDVFFMVPDLCHVVLPLLELHRVALANRLPSAAHAISNREFFATLAFVVNMWILCRII